MQPYTRGFAQTELTKQQGKIVIGQESYRADVAAGVVIETGPSGTTRHRIVHVLGGKYVYYFLTSLKNGRLQTLPIGYDVERKEWFDTAASGMRHFPTGERGGIVDWREYPYTFNSACHGCHVSQLATNYDLASDSYHTTWTEPGINCETCHASGVEHIRLARATPGGRPLPELKLISTRTLTKAQRNDLCSSCHAKAAPLTPEYKPAERFSDHFELMALEDPDYYPDGRDLGENYTLTSWSLSPCVPSGQIDCLHCHTSSGRYRFDQSNVNNACAPCHADKVGDPTPHTHHSAGSPGSRCVSCHMPKTTFARMNRSDHSMLPPTPATTMAYGSPNACNGCHTNEDAAWADTQVRQWSHRDYQAPVLKRAGLIDAARKRDWARLPEMLNYITDPDHDEIFAASLIRLVPPTHGPEVQAALLTAARAPSPLVRGAAVQALGLVPDPASLDALIAATGDASRLVRVRAAAAMASVPAATTPPGHAGQVAKATQEYLASIMARPDQWTSHYNLGNYRLDRGEYREAVASYEAALKFDPRAVMAMVNSSIAHARMGDNDKAETSLLAALNQAPDNAAANFNMGLLKLAKDDLPEAETYLREAFKADSQMAPAAYNLAVIAARDRISEATMWCRRALELRPEDPKYAYTLAFYLSRAGENVEAVLILNELVRRNPRDKDAAALLKELSE